MKHAAVLFDKDGTLLDDVPYNVDPTLMRFAPGAGEALAILAAHGFRLFVISNQSGVALGRFPYDALGGMQAHLAGMFEACGVTLDGAYWCPHHPEGIVARYAHRCACRKPQPGLLLRAAREHEIDLRQSWFVGDILDDIEAGTRAGCRTVLIDNGHETLWEPGPARVPTLREPDLLRAALAIIREHDASVHESLAFKRSDDEALGDEDFGRPDAAPQAPRAPLNLSTAATPASAGIAATKRGGS